MSYALYGVLHRLPSALHRLPKDSICEVLEVAHVLLCFVLFT